MPNILTKDIKAQNERNLTVILTLRVVHQLNLTGGGQTALVFLSIT